MRSSKWINRIILCVVWHVQVWLLNGSCGIAISQNPLETWIIYQPNSRGVYHISCFANSKAAHKKSGNTII